ncbi:MAG: hypothetical protein AAF517_28685, partial [Planctomycetota bacterium]
MDVLEFGYYLLWIAVSACGMTALLSLVGVGLKDRRYVVAARSGFYIQFALLLGVSACLVYGFVSGAYNNEYIFSHSERGLFFGYKLAGLWAGLEGSLIFWTVVLSALCAIAALQHRWSARHPAGRRIEPFAYLVMCAVMGFFLFLSVHENAFEGMELEQVLFNSQRFNVALDGTGMGFCVPR